MWFWEAGPDPLIVVGAADPRNIDISSNPGFKKLLDCWIVGWNAADWSGLPQSSHWSINGLSFWWHYALDRWNAAGGFSAFRPEIEFLGSYWAYVTPAGSYRTGKCAFNITMKNTSRWSSGTGLPGIIQRVSGGRASVFPDHARRAGPYKPSTGGNWDQQYQFVATADCCPKCTLP